MPPLRIDSEQGELIGLPLGQHRDEASIAQGLVLEPQDYGRPLQVIGVSITVPASRAQTQGHEVTLQEGPEGAGPPPHSHGWDESFYVLRGSVDCIVGERAIHAMPGCFLHLPAGTVHAFRFGSAGGAMLEIAGQGTAATAMFTRMDQDIAPGPPDLAMVAGILRDHGVTLAI